jgi:uncharacterized protein (TIGR02453 family)
MVSSAALPPEALSFLSDLAANNNRDWFHANKGRYERELRDPWRHFVESICLNLREMHPDFAGVLAKDCIFRIHRDTRFSKEKTPYKLNVAAGISAGGKQSSDPGVYVQLSAETWMIGGGAYWLSKEELHAVRNHLVAHRRAWQAATLREDFVAHFGKILGERNKRLPPEFASAAEDFSDLFLKQHYYMTELPADRACSPDALGLFLERVRAAEPVRLFLREALLA